MFREQARSHLVIFSLGLAACSTSAPSAPEAIPSRAATPSAEEPSAEERSAAASHDGTATPSPTPPIAPSTPPVDAGPSSPPRPRAAPPAPVSKGSPAAKPDPLDEVRECLMRNVPKKSSAQVLRFVSFDRQGGSAECRGRVLGAQLPDGLRRVKVCITEPPDIAGTEFLSIEATGREPDSFIYLPAEKRVLRVTGRGMSGGVCGSDLSYEDVERWQQQNRPERLERLPDAETLGRPVYVVVATPRDPKQSSYSKVVTYVDKKTCVVIQSESFQNGDTPRKVISVDPERILEAGGIHAPSDVLVKDLRDGTHSTISASELEVDGAFDRRSLESSSLGHHCR